MTQARYDTDLLGDELARSLADVERNFAAAVTVMLTHIDAAFPGCIEAVQHTMRPGAAQGTSGVRSSDVSDRTYAEVARRSRGHDRLVEIVALATEARGTIRQLEKLITSQRREADAYDLEQVKKAHRCQGDPTCPRNAVKNGLCERCGPEMGWVRTPVSSGGRLGARTGARPPWDALAEIVGRNEAASAGNLQARAARIQIEGAA